MSVDIYLYSEPFGIIATFSSALLPRIGEVIELTYQGRCTEFEVKMVNHVASGKGPGGSLISRVYVLEMLNGKVVVDSVQNSKDQPWYSKLFHYLTLLPGMSR